MLIIIDYILNRYDSVPFSLTGKSETDIAPFKCQELS